MIPSIAFVVVYIYICFLESASLSFRSVSPLSTVPSSLIIEDSWANVLLMWLYVFNLFSV